MRKTGRPAATLAAGDYARAVYAGNACHRVQVTGLHGPYLIVAHVNGAGELLLDPPGATRLFMADGLASAALSLGGTEPLAILEPEAKEARDAA